jgi:hypothetical protein
MGHFMLFETQNGALRARPPPIAAALFSFIRVMSSPSSGKAAGGKKLLSPSIELGTPASHVFFPWTIGANKIGICFTKHEMAGKSLLGKQIRQTNKSLRYARMTEPPKPLYY